MNTRRPRVSVVIPVYNESGNVRPLVEEIGRALAPRFDFELVIVDDASTDGTRGELAALLHDHEEMLLQFHTQNRGQSAAIRTGVDTATAPVIAVLDGDGQNDPADIPKLYDALISGGDVRMAVGERLRRRDSGLRRLSSVVANAVRRRLLDDGIHDTGCGLKVFYRDDFLKLPAFDHMHRFLPALVQRDGGRVRAMPVNHRPRRSGVSKYGVGNRLWVGIVDLFGVMWLKRRHI